MALRRSAADIAREIEERKKRGEISAAKLIESGSFPSTSSQSAARSTPPAAPSSEPAEPSSSFDVFAAFDALSAEERNRQMSRGTSSGVGGSLSGEPEKEAGASYRKAAEQRRQWQDSLSGLAREVPTQPPTIRASRSTLEKRGTLDKQQQQTVVNILGPIQLRAPAFAPVFGDQIYPYIKLFNFINTGAARMLISTAYRMYPHELQRHTLNQVQKDKILAEAGLPTLITIENILSNETQAAELAKFCAQTLDERNKQIAKSDFFGVQDEDFKLGTGAARLNAGQADAVPSDVMLLRAIAPTNLVGTKMTAAVAAFGSWIPDKYVIGLPYQDCFISATAAVNQLEEITKSDPSMKLITADIEKLRAAARKGEPRVTLHQTTVRVLDHLAQKVRLARLYTAKLAEDTSIKKKHVSNVIIRGKAVPVFSPYTSASVLLEERFARFLKILQGGNIEKVEAGTDEAVFALFSMASPEYYDHQLEVLRKAPPQSSLELILTLSEYGNYSMFVQYAMYTAVVTNIDLMKELSQFV
jgi:hypothetical protein